jgi:iron complex outermembrane receptor protein
VGDDAGRPLRLRHGLNPDAPCERLAENHDQQFTWRGGINYLFDNGISPYFSYSESFEPVSGSSREGKPFDPSRGKQYEAGVKYVPKDMPVVVTAAVYQLTKDKNLTADPNNQAFSIQTGEIRSRGFELEAKAAVNANINVTAAYSYTDAEYTTTPPSTANVRRKCRATWRRCGRITPSTKPR